MVERLEKEAGDGRGDEAVGDSRGRKSREGCFRGRLM